MRCRAERAGHHRVGIAALDHEAAEIKRIARLLTCLLDSDTLLLAEFLEKFGIRFCVLRIFRIDERRLLDAGKAEFKCLGKDFVAAADEGDIGNSGFNNSVGSLKSTGLQRLRKHQTLAVFLRTLGKSFKQRHNIRFK